MEQFLWHDSGGVDSEKTELPIGLTHCSADTNTGDIFYYLPYLIFVIFFTRVKFLENKIYTEKTRKLRQNTQKIANFLRYYGKIHSKLPIFRVKSVKIYTGQKKFTRASLVGSWQISGMEERYRLIKL